MAIKATTRNFALLDIAIIEMLTLRPFQRDELTEVATVRNQALRLNIRRGGVSPSASADETIHERLQALRMSGRITYDSATNRWAVF